jgi:Na+/proline symporter
MVNIFQNFRTIDIIVIAAFFLIIAAITIYYSRKGGKDTGNFFLSGRNLPWYIAGTAMVATTFAADTPLAVTELVAKNGIAGNWLWWNMAIGGMLTVFFFARLWRRAGIMTDIEFIELRYSGKAASFLRGFKAIYLGFFMNIIVMGWVNKAMEKIFFITLPGADPFILTCIIALLVAIYASVSGLLGSARTDSFQFIFALTGCIILAVIVIKIPEIGSIKNLKQNLPENIFSFFPSIRTSQNNGNSSGLLSLSIGAFIAFIGVQWWSSWYPGADPGGGGYIAQRMMSAKNEKHSLLATLWFNIAHYTLRPWPWIIVALAGLMLLPRAKSIDELKNENPEYYSKAKIIFENKSINNIDNKLKANKDFMAFYEKYENTVDPGLIYPKLMLNYLPKGLFGLLIAVFIAAYMSTIASQLNWGTSYLIHDFYRRFIKKDKSEKHYVAVSRILIYILIITSLLVTKYFLTTISGAWEFILNASAGLGLVLILRWYWWRINAWSEIIAMISPLVIYPFSVKVLGLQSPLTLFPIAFGTTLIWIAGTYLTKPVNTEILLEFYRRVHPGGIGWKKIAVLVPEVKADGGFLRLIICWLCGIVAIYATLYGTGKIILSEFFKGCVALAIAATSGSIIYIINRKKT